MLLWLRAKAEGRRTDGGSLAVPRSLSVSRQTMDFSSPRLEYFFAWLGQSAPPRAAVAKAPLCEGHEGSSYWGPAIRKGGLVLRAANLAKGRNINSPRGRTPRSTDCATTRAADLADRICFFDFCKAGLACGDSVVVESIEAWARLGLSIDARYFSKIQPRS